jgi:hypothetical protein
MRRPISLSTRQDTQRLNPLDVAIRCADRSIRGMGYPGFQTQMLIWLSSRAPRAGIGQALARLSHRRPVVTARLVEDGAEAARPYWKFQDTSAALHEIELPDAAPQSVFDCAAKLLSESHDLTADVPLRFHLLRRPSGPDVFLMQYSHVLMDKSATLQLLREIDALYHGQGVAAPQFEPGSALYRWLMHRSPAQRRAAARAAVELQGRTLRGRAAILGTGEEDKPRQAALQITARELDRQRVRAIHDRSQAVCGLPNLSMTILAAAFRAIRQLGPHERNADRNYIAGIGLDMKLHRDDRALLQNLLSVVPIFARPEELTDRDSLVRSLSEQMRERLRSNVDWGVLRLVNAYHRQPRRIQWVVEHLLRWTYSLWYAYFGPLDAIGQRFCDCPIDKVQYLGPTWSPLGLSLLANQFQGRLLMQATYDPELIDGRLAETFLDVVVNDLQAFAESQARLT